MTATDLLALDDARRAVRIPAGDTTRDADLQQTYVPAVTPIVEDVVGPVVIRPFTHRELGGVEGILLPHVGVTVTGVTVAGVAVASGDYFVDRSAGIVRSRTRFGATDEEVAVTYTAGIAADTASVPAPIRLGARLILAWLWQRDQNGVRPDLGSVGDGATTKTPSGFDVPKSAYALLEGYASGSAPGFA